MNNATAVYVNGTKALLMNDDALAELGWKDGQTITEDQAFEGIAANARSLCREIESKGLDIDISQLAAECGYKPLA